MVPPKLLLARLALIQESKMDMQEFSKFNLQRNEQSDGFRHGINNWSLSDWMTALTGEVGEAANIIKKLNRIRDGVSAKQAPLMKLRSNLEDEIADIFIYLDLLATASGFSLEQAVIKKFNKTSRKNGMPYLLNVRGEGYLKDLIKGKHKILRRR